MTSETRASISCVISLCGSVVCEALETSSSCFCAVLSPVVDFLSSVEAVLLFFDAC